MLAAAKRFDEVVRAQGRREWLADAPGKLELSGTRALVIGYGAIGHEHAAAPATWGGGARVARYGVTMAAAFTMPSPKKPLRSPATNQRGGRREWMSVIGILVGCGPRSCLL